MTTDKRIALVDAERLRQVAAIANARTAAGTFQDYRSRKAPNTLLRHGADLDAFSAFLARFQIVRRPSALATLPAAWNGITHGIVKAFIAQQLTLGFAIGTVNARLSTIRTYCALAAQAGAIPPDELTLIKTVRGYGRAEGRHADARRGRTRIGLKKSAANVLTTEQMAAMLEHDGTPTAMRDAAIVAIFCDHGLRVGELCALTVGAVRGPDLQFFRPKVNRTQTHRLSARAAAAISAYMQMLPVDSPATAPLVRRMRHDGECIAAAGLTRSGVFRIIQRLGAAVGVANLSPHDLRHSWAHAAAPFTPIDRLTEAGGWSTPATPLAVYIRPAQIANAGVIFQKSEDD